MSLTVALVLHVRAGCPAECLKGQANNTDLLSQWL
jgi:hypothetical protein